MDVTGALLNTVGYLGLCFYLTMHKLDINRLTHFYICTLQMWQIHSIYREEISILEPLAFKEFFQHLSASLDAEFTKVANCPGVSKIHHLREGRQWISQDSLNAGFQSVQTFHKLLEEIEAGPFQASQAEKPQHPFS